MRIVGRIIAVLWVGLMVSMAGAAIAALNMKRRIVPRAEPEANDVHLAAIFEPIAFESRATSFRGGEVDLWFGGGIIDLRNATLDPAGARLEVRAIFGGCQILVPAEWQVTTGVVGVGGAGDGRPKTDRPLDAPRLTVDGTYFFGGLGITSDIPAEAMRSVRQAIAKRHPENGAGVPVMEQAPEVEPVSS
jgi:Cell wall-active antibiotics response 4TMS YvqF